MQRLVIIFALLFLSASSFANDFTEARCHSLAGLYALEYTTERTGDSMDDAYRFYSGWMEEEISFLGSYHRGGNYYESYGVTIDSKDDLFDLVVTLDSMCDVDSIE